MPPDVRTALKNSYLRSIQERIYNNLPIQFTLLGAPFKTMNPLKNMSRTLPDLSELAFALKMYSLQQTIQTFYKPGIELILIHDGLYYCDPCNIPLENAIAYREYFSNMLNNFSYFHFIKPHELTELIKKTQTITEISLNKAQKLTTQWMNSNRTKTEVEAAYKKAICSMCPLNIQKERFLKSVQQYLQERKIEDNTVHNLVLDAVFEYKKKQTLIYEIKDPRKELFPNAIHASASKHPDKLSLWLVKKDESLLPWHGVGVLENNSVIKVQYETTVRENNLLKPFYLENETAPFMYSELTKREIINN